MACATRSVIPASSCTFPSRGHRSIRWLHGARGHSSLFAVCASATSEDADCNAEECAPEKEVGKVSVEWLAGEKTKVVGTYPPRRRGWTGYVEKDTAGQTNIYSVEPVVYVAESAISSGNASTSPEGSEKTATAVAGLALVSLAAASTVLFQVGKNPSQMQITEYSGPPLSYYINKFKPVNIVEAAVPSQPQSSPVVRAEGTPKAPQIDEIPQVQVELKSQFDSQTQDVSSSS